MICPQCGNENPEGANFCNHCGSSLELATKASHQQEAKAAGPEEPIGEFDYKSFKRRNTLGSFAISLAFPAIVLTILLFSYLYTLFSA